MQTFDLHKDRRRFMKMLAAAAGTPMMGSLMQAAYAAGPFNDYKALVCVFLFGGNDSQNLIIPLGAEYAGYAAGRGNLAIPAASAIPLSAGISGRSFGFHPSMIGLANIFNTDRKLAAIPNAGVLLQPTTLAQYKANVNNPPQLFSHSDMQSHWQTGRADYPALSGWGGRLGDLIESANGNSKVSVSITAAGQNLFQKGNSAVAYAVSGWSGPKSTIVRRLRSYRSWDNYSASRPNPQAAFENQLNILRSNIMEDQWGDAGARALTTSEFVNGVLYNLDAGGAPAKDASGNVSEKFAISPAPPTSFINSSGASQSNRLAGQLRSVANLIAARDALEAWARAGVAESDAAMAILDPVLAQAGDHARRIALREGRASTSRRCTTGSAGRWWSWRRSFARSRRPSRISTCNWCGTRTPSSSAA